MAKKKSKLTFFGKPLRAPTRASAHTYSKGNEDVYLYWGVAVIGTMRSPWVARVLIPGLAGICARATTQEEALTKCEAQCIATFRDMGATLGYDVD